MNLEQVGIAISRVGHPVAYMAFLTVGHGNVLPSGARWSETPGWWLREQNDLNIMTEIEATHALDYGKSVTGWRVLKPSEDQVDRTYRNAMVDNGALNHDMAMAREVHRGRLRMFRAPALRELDAQWMRSTGQGKKSEVAEIESKRQAWRDAPADPRIDAAQTVEDLKAVTGP